MTAPWGWLAALVGRTDVPADEPPISHPPVSLTGAEVVARALSVVGQGVYQLGKGGRNPEAPSPLIGGRCDCSGFASWCSGLDRYQPDQIDGDWISTTSIYRDATGPRRMFDVVELAAAQPGDLVVYPSRYRLGVRTGIGHVGVVVAVTGPGWSGLDVVDCAGRRPPAIAHRPDGGALWGRRGGAVVRRR
jgi:cell wall-associated NlpC family hydrolase